MGRIITSIIGGLLIALGAVSTLGAFEVARGGASTEAIAQGFLVPVSLFVVGGFVIRMGWQSHRG